MQANISEIESHRSMVKVGPMLKNNMCGIDSIQQINDYEDEDDIVAFDQDFIVEDQSKAEISKNDSKSFRQSLSKSREMKSMS